MKTLLFFILGSSLLSQADIIKILNKKGYSSAPADVKVCSEDYNASSSQWKISDKDKMVLCVSPDQSPKEAQRQKPLATGRNVLPLMSEFVLVAKSKPTSVCSNDEVREVDCAAFLSENKIEVMITHKKMPGLQTVHLVECKNGVCEKKKGCSSQIPISASFRQHKLKDFLLKISADAKKIESAKPPHLKDYTVDEQIVLVRLALKEDNVDAEKILNWFTLGKNCKDDCISADDFFEDRDCRKK